MTTQQRSLVIAVGASVLVHLALAALLRATQKRPEVADDGPDLIMVDINEAPEADEAHAPKADDQEPSAPADPAPVATVEVSRPRKPKNEPVIPIADAGVPDARVRIARPRADAGAALAAGGDGGAPRDAGARLAAIRDGGAAAGDAGAVASAGSDAGVGPRAVAGASANLLRYLPRGEVVTVLIRWDRLRPTEWAKRTEAIMAPMPDYQMMMGGRHIPIARSFDSMVISSSNPRAVDKTTVVARSKRKSNAQIRKFLDHPRAPVVWSTARGGPLGIRKPSPLALAGDKRLYLMPFPGWVILGQPASFGKLTEPAAGDIDSVAASPADLPRWLARLRTIEAASGAGAKGSAVLVTYAGFSTGELDVPLLGKIPAPRRLTLALEADPKGFFVRGEILFADAKSAERFVTAVRAFQSTIVQSNLGRRVLDRAKAYNAAKQLSVRRGGRKVAYSTSISIADGREMMKLAAEQTKIFYGKRRRRRRLRKGKP